MNSHTLTVGICQITPNWLNKKLTLEKVAHYMKSGAEQGCQLMAFGEALIPGYPFWVELTDGARFNNDIQKDLYAHYLQEAVDIAGGDLKPLCEIAAQHDMATYVGTIEKATDRGGHSLYCSLVYINEKGKIQSIHRKLMPTYEERLVWAVGDGNGLQVHDLKGFRVGGLNCWENWMPLPRTALYAQGENVHVAVWPGNLHNTEDITRFIAQEARSYVISVSGILHKIDIDDTIPHAELIRSKCKNYLANGGSCIADPSGNWIVAPITEQEVLQLATLERGVIYRERHNFDPVGHYSRPDITQLHVNRERQGIAKIHP